MIIYGPYVKNIKNTVFRWVINAVELSKIYYYFFFFFHQKINIQVCELDILAPWGKLDPCFECNTQTVKLDVDRQIYSTECSPNIGPFDSHFVSNLCYKITKKSSWTMCQSYEGYTKKNCPYINYSYQGKNSGKYGFLGKKSFIFNRPIGQ